MKDINAKWAHMENRTILTRDETGGRYVVRFLDATVKEHEEAIKILEEAQTR